MSIIRKTFSCFLLALFPLVVFAQPQSAINHRAPGLDSLLINIENTMKREHMPGVMLAMVTKDAVIYAGSVGYSDMERQIKADSSTLFHMHSVTKMFTALAIQKLIAEGKLRLDDKLQSVAPEIAFKNPWEATDPVRVVHLLEHTAGFDDVHLNGMFNRSGKALKGLKAVAAISPSLKSRWRPGERTSYSNPGYVVLGYLIEKLSGKPWNDYARQNVLLPLGMTTSVYDLDGRANFKYAKGYRSNGNHYQPFLLATPGGNGAGSALVTNAQDMAMFIKNLLNGWKTKNGQWLPEEDLAELERVHSTLAAKYGLQTGYALANQLFPNNKKITFRGHNGMGEGFNSWILYNREAGVGYAVCNNGDKGMWPVSRLIEDFLTKGFQAPKLQESKQRLDRFVPLAGYYQFANPRSEMFGFHERIFNGIRLSVVNNKLVVTRAGGRTDTLVSAGGNLFRAKGQIIPSFVLGTDKEGRPFFQGYLDNYYQRTSYVFILLQKVLIYATGVAMLLSILVALITLILKLFKKATWAHVLLTIVPALAVILLYAGNRKLRLTDELDKTAFSTINLTTLSIFFETLGFGVFSVAALYLLFTRWLAIPQRWLKVLLAFNAIFIFYGCCLLFYHGFVGIRTWTL